MLTVAPGTAAPVPSTIVPVMLPYNTCAAAVVGSTPIVAASATTIRDRRNRRRHSRLNTLATLTAILLGKNPETVADESQPPVLRNELPHRLRHVNVHVRPVQREACVFPNGRGSPE